MSSLSQEMQDWLNQSFNWRLENIPELDHPVLIVLDYSPGNDQAPVSIAFDCTGGPKCWLTEPQVFQRNGIGPNRHDEYRQFVFEGRRFFPYSIAALPKDMFEIIEQFEDACRSLYEHTVQEV